MGEEAGKLFLNSVISALHELHVNGNSHGDLKLENIVLDSQFNMKLIDFGMATQKNISSQEGIRGTPQYMAPEILEGKVYSGDRVDLFSVGVILFMIVTGHGPFEHKSHATAADPYYSQLMAGNEDSFFAMHEKSHLSPECQDVIARLLSPDVNKRMTIEKLKNHPFQN